MHISFAVAGALAAATSVLATPFPAVERAPEAMIIYAEDLSGPGLQKRSVSECRAVNAVISALKAASKATVFCSSYLHIPKATSTITSTTTVTPDAVPTTATITPAEVIIPSTTTVTTSDLSKTSTVYSHFTPPAAKAKRAAQTLPSYVSAFGASKVSKACSCLSIPTSTTTVTMTVGKTLAASTTTTTTTAETPTTTVVSTTTNTIVAETTVPALCAPSVLALTNGALSSTGNDSPNLVTQAGITDITSCCAACLATQNCLSYFIPPGAACRLVIAVDTSSPNTGNAAQDAICPLGVNGDDTLFPAGVSAPESGDSAFHVGPCLIDATALI